VLFSHTPHLATTILVTDEVCMSIPPELGQSYLQNVQRKDKETIQGMLTA